MSISKDKVYVNDTWITNGHVMVRRESAVKMKPNPFKAYVNVVSGTYNAKAERYSDCPDTINGIVPKELGESHSFMKVTKDALYGERVISVMLQEHEGYQCSWVNSEFLPFLDLGTTLRQDITRHHGAIYVVDDKQVIQAIVMPMRVVNSRLEEFLKKEWIAIEEAIKKAEMVSHEVAHV